MTSETKKQKKTATPAKEKWLSDEQAKTVQKTEAEADIRYQPEASGLAKAGFMFAMLALSASALLYLETYKQYEANTALQATLESQLSELYQVQSRQGAQLQTIVSHNPSSWIAAEALFLLRMADRKLELEHDQTTALSLMKESRMLMGTIREPQFIRVFDEITLDMQRLEKVEATNVQKTSRLFTEVIEQIDTLPLLVIRKTPDIDVLAQKQVEPTWEEKFTKTWKDLLFEVVTVRHHETLEPAFMLPEQEWYIRENMRRQASHAQLALYRQDATTYQSSMRTLHNWVNRYGDLKQFSAQETLQNVKRLQNVVVYSHDHIQLSSIALLENVLHQGDSTVEEQSL